MQKYKAPYSGKRSPSGGRSSSRHPVGDSRGGKQSDSYGLSAPRSDRLVRGGLGDKGSGSLPKRGR